MKQIKIKNSNLTRSSFLILSIIASLLILKINTAPYVLLGLIWIVTILFLSFTDKRNFVKIIGINLSAAILAFILYESYLWFKSGEFYIKRSTQPFEQYRVDKFLGFAPDKNRRINETKYYKDKLVFNATYSIDKNGLRISPPYDEFNLKGCVLFFGCSFTYGIGVNDNKTLPYQVGIQTHGNYRIYNFGLGGYGPHQMLSELEHNIVKNIVSCNGTTYAIYQAIPDHINRAAGLSYWDVCGPRYVLAKNGEVSFAGNFDDVNIFPKVILKYLNKSLIYRDIIGNRRFFNRDKDIDLYVRIICAAKKNFEKQYPGGKFHIIFWDNRFTSDEKPEKTLEWMKVLNYFIDNGISLHLTSDIIPDYQNNKSKYILSPYDTHPNALAHRLVAEYVVSNILRE